MTDLMEKSKEIGDFLYRVYQSEQKDGTGDLLIQWSMDQYYTNKVNSYRQKMRELVKFCIDNGITSDEKSVWYGDMDVYVWLENNTHLILQNVVTTRDNTIFVYYLKEFSIPDEFITTCVDNNGVTLEVDFLDKFICQILWETETLAYDTPQFNDHRDIDHPSLKTLRDNDYKYGYGDCRDNCYGFSLKHGRVEGGLAFCCAIEHSLIELDYAHNAIIVQKDFTKTTE